MHWKSKLPGRTKRSNKKKKKKKKIRGSSKLSVNKIKSMVALRTCVFVSESNELQPTNATTGGDL